MPRLSANSNTGTRNQPSRYQGWLLSQYSELVVEHARLTGEARLDSGIEMRASVIASLTAQAECVDQS